MNFEFSLILRSSVLLLIASLLAGLFGRKSAANRYVIWAVGLIAILILPIVSILLPEITLPLLPSGKTSIASATSSRAIDSDGKTDVVSDAALPTNSTTNSRTVQSFPRQWMFGLWTLGGAVIVSRCLFGIKDVGRLKRNSSPVVDPDWNAILSRLKGELGVTSDVDLRVGGDAIPPMTWGVLRHTILFPRSAGHWAPDRVRDVMVHELAHVQRKDGLMQLFAQAACAIYWFNPLVRYAAYRLRVERERACDDQVLKLGTAPEDYADHLLQIARTVNTGFHLPTMSMTHLSGFEKRLRLVLDPTTNRKTFSHRSTVLLMCCAALVTTIVASGHLTARQIQAPKWAGTWKLNKDRSTPARDPRVLELFASIQTAILKLEPAANTVKVSADIIAGRLSQRLVTESAIPVGVPFDMKDMQTFMLNPGAVASPGGTVLLTPADNSLQLQLDWRSGGRTVITYEISDGGNTLTVSIPPPDFTRMVFDRQ